MLEEKVRELDVNEQAATVDAAVLAAAIAAVVSIAGFLLNQWWARRERRAKTFADAMAAFTRWEQIPFTIWQRPDSSAETRSRLGRETTECFIAVTFHVALLHIESPPAGEAYVLLINKLQKQKNDNQDLAWRSPLLVGDENMAVNPPFTFDVKASAELRLCRLAMRRELSAWSRLSRRNTCKKLAATRSEHGPTDHEETRALAGNQRSDNL